MNQFFALAICFLCGFTDVKIADVQIVEVVIIAAFCLSFLVPEKRMVLQGPSVITDFIPKFVILLMLLLAGSLLSLRLDFFPIADTGPLKQPPYASLIRLIEVSFSISSMFYVALTVRGKPNILKNMLAVFVWSALVGTIWAMISFVAWYAGIELPGVTAGTVPRMAGFFVEGGPFGVFLVGAIILQIVRGHYLGYVSRRTSYLQLGVLIVGLLGTQSKAAVALSGAVAIVFLMRTRHFRLVALMAVLMVPVAVTSNLISGVEGYYHNYTNYQQAASERPDDKSLIAGRLAAAVLLPRIVAEHPILGVGLGNYALVRNDPNILRGLPYLSIWDAPGLGLFGYLAELGIPLTLFVLWLYAYPLLQAWRSRPWIVLLCSYPVLAAIFGVQLNFAYPWIIAGIGLATIAIDRKHRTSLGSGTVAAATHQLRAASPSQRPPAPNALN
ncbi:hypothetical protein GCM10022268_33700 [Sphingomonas cynarae]|uniref:O-antigen ligase-related domain-containing protein n=1 Tax=Sphingomonas cynarae TaxID=930197 RepID=A0ABP7ER56_9SPHN